MNLTKKSAVKAFVAGALVVVAGLVLYHWDSGLSTAIILSLTAAGVVAYAALVHDQVKAAELSLTEQRDAGAKQQELAQEQIRLSNEQIQHQREIVMIESERWRETERRIIEGRLDTLMPTLEIAPVEYGIFDSAQSGPIGQGATFNRADDEWLTLACRVQGSSVRPCPYQHLLPIYPRGRLQSRVSRQSRNRTEAECKPTLEARRIL